MTDYSKIASEYAEHRQILTAVLDNLVTEGELIASSKVLEVGCGTGNYTRALNKTIGSHCLGIDPSDEMLSIARERSPMTDFQFGRAEKLDFQASYFDLVFSVDVIHHISDRKSYFSESYRILKDGAKLCTVTDSEWIIQNRRPQSLYFPESIEVELKRYPKIREIEELMSQYGFVEIFDTMVEQEYELRDIEGYRKKVFSALLLITEDEFQRGLKQMEEDFSKGPIKGISRYMLVWGTKPQK